jgi:hypothetical protein
MSAAGIRRVVVIEYLIVGGAASAPALVAPAQQFSNEQGAKRCGARERHVSRLRGVHVGGPASVDTPHDRVSRDKT